MYLVVSNKNLEFSTNMPVELVWFEAFVSSREVT
jgi:hypothetical protein